MCFHNQLIKHNDQPRQNRKNADQADEYSFCKDNPHILPDFKTHKNKDKKPYNCRNGTACNCAKRMKQRFFHCYSRIGIIQLFLIIAVHQHNGIVHRQTQLKQCAYCKCHKGYGWEQCIRSHIN